MSGRKKQAKRAQRFKTAEHKAKQGGGGTSAKAVKAMIRAAMGGGIGTSKRAGLTGAGQAALRPESTLLRDPIPSIALPAPRSVLSKAAQAQDQNAVAYVQGLRNPFTPGVRIPDEDATPSFTTPLRQRIRVPVIQDSKSVNNYYAGLCLAPNMVNGIATITASASDVFTWSVQNWGDYAEVGARVQLYRTVSMAVQEVDSGSALTRGMVCMLGVAPSSYAFGQTTPAAYNRINTLEFMDSTRNGLAEVDWYPLSDGDTNVFGPSGVVPLSGTVWKPPSADLTASYFIDNVIVFIAQITGSTPSDFFFLDIIMNIEWMPLAASQVWGDPVKVIGSGSSIDRAMYELGPPPTATGVKLKPNKDQFNLDQKTDRDPWNGNLPGHDREDDGEEERKQAWAEARMLEFWKENKKDMPAADGLVDKIGGFVDGVSNAIPALIQIGEKVGGWIGAIGSLFGDPKKANRLHVLAYLYGHPELSPYDQRRHMSASELEEHISALDARMASFLALMAEGTPPAPAGQPLSAAQKAAFVDAGSPASAIGAPSAPQQAPPAASILTRRPTVVAVVK